MKGFIQSDVKGGCPCGGKFTLKEELGYQVPKCEKCEKFPKKLRIGRYLPSLEGKGQKVFIRYDHRNKRLESIQQAIRTLEFIDYELEEGKFDPRKYASRIVAQQLTFEHFVRKRFFPAQEQRLDRKELSPGGYKAKMVIIKSRLIPHFGPMDMRDITTGKIQLFYETLLTKIRTGELCIQELGCIFKYALKLEYIDRLPLMPKVVKKRRLKDAENFPDPDQQDIIINNIKNTQYRCMIKILSIYALRPCEVQVLRWKDLDFENGIITIQRHVSGNEIIEGRKSHAAGEKGSIHYLPMLPTFYETIKDIPRGISPDSLIFTGCAGSYVSYSALRYSWRMACKKIGSTIDLYEGTKHARMTYLKGLGYSDNELMLVTGHSSVEVLKRYAQMKKTQHLKLIETMLSR